MPSTRTIGIAAASMAALVGCLVYTGALGEVSELAASFQARANELKTTLLDLGPMGPVLVFAIYLVTTVFMLPLWGFHMTCWYVYGTFWSAVLISFTQAFCAGVAFSVSRYVVRDCVRGALQRRFGRKFTAIDAAVGKDGFRITLLLRLSPIIPFGMNNYVCGCTDMRLVDFVVGTWLGILPGTTAYCNMGALSDTLMEGETTPLQRGVMVIGVAAALWVIHVLNKLATKALKEAGIDDDNDETTSKGKKPKKASNTNGRKGD